MFILIRIVYFIFTCIGSTTTYLPLVVPGTTEATSSRAHVARINGQDYNFWPQWTVDGNVNQSILACLHTAVSGVTEAWLRIDLGRVKSIYSIQIWYRNDRTDVESSMGRMQGYSIRVLNETTIPVNTADVCFRDSRTTYTSTVLLDICKRSARYIIIYQNHKLGSDSSPILEICEVQVFGCETGYYGYNCSKKCDHCRNNSTCDIENGICDNAGCAFYGYIPPSCNKCLSVFYGADCSLHCSEFCLNSLCNNSNGECLQGCKPGREGLNCSQTCPAGSYGDGCEYVCGQCSDNSSCHHVTGTCQNGCDKGFMGELCSIPCSNGSFGSNCLFNCSGNCFNNETCDSREGKCLKCAAGWDNPFCNSSIAELEGVLNKENADKSEIHGITIALSVGIFIIIFLTVFFSRLRKSVQLRQRVEDIEYDLPDMTRGIEGLQDDINVYEDLDISEEMQTYQNSLCISENDTVTLSENTTRPITITDLLSIIKTLEKDANLGFKREFESLPTRIPELSSNTGDLWENVSKNKYATTLPYDDLGVSLCSRQNDYINANFINNVNEEQTYIATQDPTPTTISVFWQMVWRENIHVIATVKNILDRSKRVCETYLPENNVDMQDIGEFAVKLESTKVYSNFIIRQIQLAYNETSENRNITHLEFTAWTATPIPLDLVMFYHYVSRALDKNQGTKLLVHCSSGAGPTAVVIALDALYTHGVKTGVLNIAEFVREMRKERSNMIQNLDQYVYLYKSLYECTRAKGCLRSKAELQIEVMRKHITNEFSILLSISSSVSGARNSSNSEKCLQSEYDVPKGDKREPAFSRGQLQQCSAILLSSFTTQDCIIAGRYPSHGEAVDLIHLLTNQRYSTLVSIHPLSEVPYSKEWFFQSVDVQDYQVEVIPVAKMSEHVTLSTLRAKRSLLDDSVFARVPLRSTSITILFVSDQRNDQKWHQTTVYELTSWKYSENIPYDINTMLDVIKSVQLDNSVDINKKLIILSKDGATGCGVFCAVYNAIQQLQQDEEVDMFTIVRQLQSRRQEMISDMSEYLCCYNAVKQYLERK